jgi:hypothetical protein
MELLSLTINAHSPFWEYNERSYIWVRGAAVDPRSKFHFPRSNPCESVGSALLEDRW